MQPISVVGNVIPACQLSTIDRFILGPSVGNWEFIWPTTTLSNGANKKTWKITKKNMGVCCSQALGIQRTNTGKSKNKDCCKPSETRLVIINNRDIIY